jgi:hypothetical protein
MNDRPLLLVQMVGGEGFTATFIGAIPVAALWNGSKLQGLSTTQESWWVGPCDRLVMLYLVWAPESAALCQNIFFAGSVLHPGS